MNTRFKFKAEKYPDELASGLMNLAGYCDPNNCSFFRDVRKPQIKQDLEECLQQLLAVCENELNFDFYRTLYRTLENIVNECF